MTAYDLTVGNEGSVAPALRSKGLEVLDILLDFEANPKGAGDVLTILDIPAGAKVLYTDHQVVEAEGGAATGKLGDGDDDDGYIASINFNATAGACLSNKAHDPVDAEGAIVPAFSFGKFYAAAGALKLTVTNALDNAKVIISVAIIRAAVA